MGRKLSELESYLPLTLPVAIKNQVWPKGVKPVVAVRVLTFNHENYIRECLDGILMQETTFPVRIVIFEDCSKDTTAEIIKEYQNKYPYIIYAFCQEENTYQKPTRQKALQPYFDSSNEAKYIAYCDGDDFWVDPKKLQKQVEYLEQNPKAYITYHNATQIDHDHSKILKKDLLRKSHQKNYTAEDLLKGHGHLPTLTWVLRSGQRPQVRNFSHSINGDRMTLVSIGMIGGEAHYVAGITNAVYRHHVGGVWSQIGETKQMIEQLNTRMILARHFALEGNNELAMHYVKYLNERAGFNMSLKELLLSNANIIKMKIKLCIRRILNKAN